jgi:hypothetical protein
MYMLMKQCSTQGETHGLLYTCIAAMRSTGGGLDDQTSTVP